MQSDSHSDSRVIVVVVAVVEKCLCELGGMLVQESRVIVIVIVE